VLKADAQDRRSFGWQDPLGKLATDIARGLVHMHSRRWFDEAANKMQECCLNRDLKPENVLVTDSAVGKLSDFGPVVLFNPYLIPI